jgi:membrane associated rhomboid family serine protease
MTFPQLLRKPFRYTFSNATLIIAGVNLLVYLAVRLNPILARYLALNPDLVVGSGMFWQVFTYQFVHDGFSHILFNMLGLLVFGMAVERRLGSREFCLLYLLCGTLSGVISLAIYVLTNTWYVFLMGASGAVFSLLLAYAVLFPKSQLLIWGIIPVPAPLLVIGYAGIEIFDLLTGANSGVAHGTHLAGFAVAWVYFLVRFNINPIKVWRGL